MLHAADSVAPDTTLPKRGRGRPPKAPDALDDGNRRQALLAAAAKLFRKKGFAATTTRDIATAAGMQSGSPFYHFKSKDALLFAVMQAGMHTALARQRALTEESGFAGRAPAAQLRGLVQAHFDVLPGPRNDFVPVMLYEWRALQRSQRKALAALIAEYEAIWLPVLQSLHESGALRAPVPLARLLILGALNWSVQWFNPKKGADLRALTQATMQMFIKE